MMKCEYIVYLVELELDFIPFETKKHTVTALKVSSESKNNKGLASKGNSRSSFEAILYTLQFSQSNLKPKEVISKMIMYYEIMNFFAWILQESFYESDLISEASSFFKNDDKN